MSTPVWTVTSSKSVRYASELMSQLKIGSLVVQDYETVLGIITSRDIRETHPNRIVADAMTSEPVCVPIASFAWDALDTMERLQLERLLVTDKEHLCGMITRDTIRIRLKELQDPMTGLFRQPFVHSIGTDFLRKKRGFHLLFIDLNNFGEINKQYGHPIGDDLIRGYSEWLDSLGTSDDYLCRYAGDEFVILSARPAASLLQLVEVLHEPVMIEGIEVTTAIGIVSDLSEPDFFQMSFRELISRASLHSTSLKPGNTYA